MFSRSALKSFCVSICGVKLRNRINAEQQQRDDKVLDIVIKTSTEEIKSLHLDKADLST